MSQQDGLGVLQVCVPRQVSVTSLTSAGEQHLLEGDHTAPHFAQSTFGEQPQVGGHLVIPAPSSVQSAPDIAGELGDSPLYRGMHVLVAGIEHEVSLGDLLLDLAQCG